jgi:hypothetical protein
MTKEHDEDPSSDPAPAVVLLRACVGSLLLPARDLQELSEIPPEVTLRKRRSSARIGEFLPDNVDDPKSHPYHKNSSSSISNENESKEPLIVKIQRKFRAETETPPPAAAEADYWNSI